MKKFDFAKGLQSLIPVKSKIIPQEKKESVYYIEVKKIKPNPDRSGKEPDKSGLEELADSIRRYGILQPILVSKMEKRAGGGIKVDYRLIAGQRRLYAAKLAGLRVVPAIIKGEDRKLGRRAVEKELSEIFQTQATVSVLRSGRGRVLIKFANSEHLKKIIDKILG